MAKTSKRSFLVSVDGLPDYYATLAGGEVSVDTSDAWDGGQKKPEKVPGVPTTSNLTLSRPYDPDRDQPLIDRLQALVGTWRTTVTKQPTDGDFTPVGKPTTYPKALLVRVLPPEADAAASENSTYELEFATDGPA